MSVIEQAKYAKEVSIKLGNTSTKLKNELLQNIADSILKNKDKIIKENKKDIENAAKENLSDSLLKRLKVDSDKIKEIVNYVNSVKELDDPARKEISKTELDKGLLLSKVSCPIGVIGVVFESRPDALVQIAVLCLKSGNSVILKGGSEAKNTNKIIFEIIKEQTGKIDGWIQLIQTRGDVKEILKLNEYIDLIIPRGSNKFVKYIMDNTSIPVLGHADGICHVFVDKEADIDMAVKICLDAKCQYPAVCNAMETLLVHKDVANELFKDLIKKYIEAGVELRLDEKSLKLVNIDNKKIKIAKNDDWKTEYNDLILSIKIVNNIDVSIEHINIYGSGHTDAIITKNHNNARKFMNLVDSSSVMHNCSTRFADGFRYGLGAEVGISTNKIHARGPVGLEGLMIYKYKLYGKGNIVKDYCGKKAKKFLHKKIK